MRNLTLSISLLALTAGVALGNPPLREIAEIDDAVFDVAVADQIRRKCPDIAPRYLKALSLYRATRAKARSMGYTDEQIEDYADSKTEKARMRARGDAYFAANGVVASDPQSYCALGRKEIQKSSRIGSLLRTK